LWAPTPPRQRVATATVPCERSHGVGRPAPRSGLPSSPREVLAGVPGARRSSTFYRARRHRYAPRPTPIDSILFGGINGRMVSDNADLSRQFAVPVRHVVRRWNGTSSQFRMSLPSRFDPMSQLAESDFASRGTIHLASVGIPRPTSTPAPTILDLSMTAPFPFRPHGPLRYAAGWR